MAGNKDEIARILRENLSGVYKDEPIVIPASRMKSYTPQRIIQMQKMTSSQELKSASMNRIFYRQGKFMEDYTDSFDHDEDFSCYFPTYSVLSVNRLRGYFSWRTRIRNGETPPAPMPYVCIYIYELICGIGVPRPEWGFEQLVKTEEAYREAYPQLQSSVKKWLHDYVIYYNLSGEYMDRAFDMPAERAYSELTDYKNVSDEALAGGIIQLASYHTERSVFYKKHPEDMKVVLAGVYRRLCEHYEKNRKTTFPSFLFGAEGELTCYMFSSAVFYDWRKYEEYEYEISGVNSYICRKGHWKKKGYYEPEKACRKLGSLVKTVDSLMRSAYGGFNPINRDTDKKYVLRIIEDEINGFLSEKKKQRENNITLDLSKLGDIRAAADITRDRLMTEAEAGADIIPETEIIPENITHTPPAENSVTDDGGDNAAGLSEGEYAVIRALLYGKDAALAAKSAGLPVSVLCDGINDKLYDMFGDTVIIFEGDVPVIIEDYTDGLKDIFPR